ncbi:hypothetical protein, partial [Bacillus cereus]
PVNPDTVAVKGYVRTAPDGDVTNNLSHHGPDAKTVNVETQGNDYVKTSLDGDTATSKGSSQWDDMTPEQKETVMTAFNGVAVGQGMVDKILKGVEREKGRNGFCGHCGKERSGKGRFCVSCGGSLEYDEQTPKQTNDRKRGNFIVVGIIGVIVVAGALFMAKSSLITNDEKVATSTEFSEGMETKKLSTAALSDIDGYWVDKGIPSYVGIKITGDKRGEITFYSGEENTTYLFKLQNSEEKKMSLRIYEEKSNVASFVPFNARVNIVDDQQIELIRLGQEEDNLSLTRMTKDEFMNYYEPVDEKKAYTGKNEQFKNAKTKIPFVQIESSWINISGGPNISFILAEGERSGELIIEQGQPGGGRLPQHKFYISSEPKDGDNTYIISLQQTSGEYRDVELTLTEDQLRMKMDGEESFYRKG